MTREDRMARAGDYVLGRMDEAERERAERDLQIDAEFRDCVLQLARRFHVIGAGGDAGAAPEAMWSQIATRLAGLPQMGGGQLPSGIARHEDGPRRDPIKASWLPASTASRLALAVALLVACGLGYLAGRYLP